jgi:hypothetical protein
MKKIGFLISAVVVLALMVTGCASSAKSAIPTQAPTPTPTTIAGIDYPVEVQGVTLQFISAAILHDDETVMLIQAKYAGNISRLFAGPYKSNGRLFIKDSGGTEEWKMIVVDVPDSTINIFFPVTSTGPYSLVNRVGTSWSIDLTPLLARNAPPNTNPIT